MAIDLKESPYFDDYDPSKYFTKIVGVPGRVSQVREFTQAQDIQEDHLKRLGNAVLRNGTVVSGCTINIADDTRAEITSGQVFIDGMVRNVPSTSIDIQAEGTERIGILITPTIVREGDDSSLYDNAEGYKNYGNAGAHRIKEEPVWTLDTEGQVDIFELVDGQPVHKTDDDTIAQVTEILARRTFDENGSYKVNGLKILDRKSSDENTLYVSVQEGKAYVAGYETVKEAASRIGISKALTTRTQYNETKEYQPEVTYPFDSNPVDTIDEVNCMVQKTAEMTRGNIPGGLDRIQDKRQGSITEVVKVWAGDTVYEPTRDYVFEEGGISWAPSGGTEPGTGTSYQVTYNYNQRMEPTEYKLSHNDSHRSDVTYTLTRGEGQTDRIPMPDNCKVVAVKKVYKDGTEYLNETDWRLTGDVGNYQIDWTPDNDKPEESYRVDLTILVRSVDDSKYYLEFTEQVETPVIVGSTFTLDYTFYLARMDLIVMRPDSVCEVIEGLPDVLYKVFPPTNTNDRVLPLGTVLALPNSDELRITNFSNYRLDQSQLYNVRQRVDNLEYNVAMDDLDNEAMEGETATLLKGIFTDGFIGPTKADVSHPDFDCSFDFDRGYLMLPQNEGIVGMTPDRRGNASVRGGIASAPYENVVLTEQLYATEDFLVNPYDVYENLAILEIDPYVDNWVDSTRLTVDGGTSYETRYEDVNGGTRYVDGGTVHRRETRGTIFPDYDVVTHDYRTTTETTTSSRVNETTRTQTDIVLDEAIEYMRPIEVQVHGSNYTLNADNLEGLFNGEHVDLTPVDATQPGSDKGTVRSNDKGRFDAKFTIPEGIPCGTVDVEVNNINNEGGTRFSAQGRRQIVQDTVFRTVTTTQVRTHTTVVTDYTTITTIHDPLAESFFVEEDCVLTQLGLFFSEKDDAKNLIIEIRDLNNGYPSSNILHQQVVDCDDVVVDENGQKETVITLSQPIYLEGNSSYCFVIVSDSNRYKMWTGKLGGVDEHSFEGVRQLVSQPYTEGVMFSSSNAQTWTAHQEQDLKFRLYRAKFSEVGTILYPDATMEDATALVLAAQTADYENQGVNWYYQLIGEDENEKRVWLPIETFNYMDLDRISRKIALKCELHTKKDTLSPFLNVESVNLIYYNNDNKGAYISRQVVMEQEFNTLQLSVEGYTPDTTEFKVWWTNQDDNTGWTELTEPTVAPVDQYFSRYTFTKDSLPAGTRKCRVKITLSSENKLYTPVLRRLMVVMKNV